MSEPIRGSVAAILNDRELVINRGSEQGVELGMQFVVLNRKGTQIVDPETGEDLGSVDLKKTVVKVVRVQDRLCVGRTFRTYRDPGSGLAKSFVGLSPLGRPPSKITETLRINSGTYQAEIDDEESFVKPGDPVLQVVDDEFVDEKS